MEALGIYPPTAVVKVGDTVPDIGEGLAAGAWSVGVLRSSSEVGCTEEEWDSAAGRRTQREAWQRAQKSCWPPARMPWWKPERASDLI